MRCAAAGSVAVSLGQRGDRGTRGTSFSSQVESDEVSPAGPVPVALAVERNFGIDAITLCFSLGIDIDQRNTPKYVMPRQQGMQVCIVKV